MKTLSLSLRSIQWYNGYHAFHGSCIYGNNRFSNPLINPLEHFRISWDKGLIVIRLQRFQRMKVWSMLAETLDHISLIVVCHFGDNNIDSNK